MGACTIDKALHEKVVQQVNGRRLSAENFDGENVDELIKIRQIHQYFPPSKFCAIWYWLLANSITAATYLKSSMKLANTNAITCNQNSDLKCNRICKLPVSSSCLGTF